MALTPADGRVVPIAAAGSCVALNLDVPLMDLYRPKLVSDQDFAALHPRFKWMRDYLARVAPPARLPGRQHVDPVAMGPVLPYINLIDVVPESGTLRFRYRLVGTKQVELSGREITGLFVEEGVVREFVARVQGNMRTVVERKAPVYDRFQLAQPDREFIASERVYFPLAADGDNVNMLLSVQAYPGYE